LFDESSQIRAALVYDIELNISNPLACLAPIPFCKFSAITSNYRPSRKHHHFLNQHGRFKWGFSLLLK
jgi:hypothetical protein